MIYLLFFSILLSLGTVIYTQMIVSQLKRQFNLFLNIKSVQEKVVNKQE